MSHFIGNSRKLYPQQNHQHIAPTSYAMLVVAALTYLQSTKYARGGHGHKTSDKYGVPCSVAPLIRELQTSLGMTEPSLGIHSAALKGRGKIEVKLEVTLLLGYTHE